MKKSLIIVICLLFYGCKEQSQIPISNTLELALGDNYSSYVENLNKAFVKDNSATLKILKVDYIYDAGGYDHGYILYLLMKRYGDKEFSILLNSMSKKDLTAVSQYLEVGLDANDTKRGQVKIDYPICSNILLIK
ncbi:hypothetical protein [Flavobacterium sp. MDT1-60]|uniref:hypothetical protein n=1 Tax=Flavobacterium sp. MDT1-60 TaxID=1979344 RepID=UPI00177EFE60|nr:hypothetical protein [Flavobacterium sp. MDT1-60]QOG04602.1 hypothetical protein IHE43_10505 [Flavobacterium sp. MDT1-60]